VKVVCDTSPLNYLVRIARIEILPALFGGIWCPPGVLEELRHDAAPDGCPDVGATAPELASNHPKVSTA
jgi:predicted nucleic acid-binding protein